MSKLPLATEEEIHHLLQLAGTSLSDKAAMLWLKEALVAARSSYQATKQRPLSADHNDLLTDVAKNARALAKQLQRLRAWPHSWHAFWRSIEPQTVSPFTRRAVAEDDVKRALRAPAHRPRVEADEVLTTLKDIERAAQTAKDERKGRPREVGKQRVIDLAFAFFVRYSPDKPSGTPTGPFAKFARAFYAAAVKVGSDDGGLDRQLRAAIDRLPIEQERAGRRKKSS